MKDVRLLVGALHNADDPELAAEALVAAVTASGAPRAAPQVDPEVVAVLRATLGKRSIPEIQGLCLAAVAWVLGGRNEAARHSEWEFVLSSPTTQSPPSDVQRATGETLASLILSAEVRCRFVIPYIDEGGLRAVEGAIAAAADRGVEITVASTWAGLRAIRLFKPTLTIRPIEIQTQTWPHLKVVTADGKAAYLGSANLTRAALAGRNVELGVLVRGKAVAQIEQVLDWLRY